MTNKRDLLEIQTNQEKELSGGTIERHEIENTPFVAIGNDDEGYHIICGRHRLNENKVGCLNDVYKYIEDKKWEIIAQLVTILVPHIINDSKN